MEALFFRVLTLSLTCGAVVGLALLLLPKLKKRYAAKTAYFLWLVLALRLVTPFEFTLPEATAVTLTPPGTTIQLPARVSGTAGVTVTGNTAVGSGQLSGVEMQTPSVSDPVSSQAPGQTGPERGKEEPTTLSIPYIAAILWLVGCAVVLLWQGGGYLLTRRTLLKWAEPADEEKTALLRELAGEKCPALYRAPVETPMILGLFHPVLLLPLEPLSGEELVIALRHELAHWKRHDVAYKTLMAAACVLHWFNPLVWLMAKQAGQTVEACCDDAVVAGEDDDFRRAYGRALLHTAAGKKAIPFTTCFGGGKEQMKERLQNLFVRRKNGPGAVCLLLCAALLMGNLVSCGETANSPEPTGEPVTSEFYGYVSAVGDESISVLPVTYVEEGDTEQRTALGLSDDDFEDGVYLYREPGQMTEDWPVDVERIDSIRAWPLRRGEAMEEMSYTEFREQITMKWMLSSTLSVHPVTGERMPTYSGIFRFAAQDGVIVAIEETGHFLSLAGMDAAIYTTYTNDTYGFSLNLPAYWEGRYTATERVSSDGVIRSIEFKQTNHGNGEGRFFNLVFEDKEEFWAQWPEKKTFAEIEEAWPVPMKILGTGEGKVFYIFYVSDEQADKGNPEIWEEYETMEIGARALGPEDFRFYGTGASLQDNTFVNLTYAFSIELPESWAGNVSVLMNGDEHATFYFDDGETMIYVMDISVLEEESPPYNARTVLLGQGNGVWVYGYLGMTDAPTVSQLDEERKELFYTIEADRETIGPEDVTFFQKEPYLG